MKRKLLLCFTILLLLAAGLAGCNSDEDKDAGPIDGWVITAFSGEKLLMKGGVLKSDSVSFNWWISKVPFKPIMFTKTAKITSTTRPETGVACYCYNLSICTSFLTPCVSRKYVGLQICTRRLQILQRLSRHGRNICYKFFCW